MSKQPSKFKQFMDKYYWLPPLLLVAIVFILVFSLEGFQNVAGTLKTLFSKNSSCKACEITLVDKNKDGVIDFKTSEGKKVYVYYFDKNEEYLDDVFAANAALNTTIKAYNKDHKEDGKEVTVYGINYGVKEYSEIVGQEDVIIKWYDKSIRSTSRNEYAKDLYEEISEDVRIYLHEQDPDCYSSTVGSYTVVAPTLVEYSKETNGYVVSNVLTGSNNFNAKNIQKFFDGTYEFTE